MPQPELPAWSTAAAGDGPAWACLLLRTLILGRPGCSSEEEEEEEVDSSALGTPVSVMLHQQQDPRVKQSPQAAVPGTGQPCEGANFSILQHAQDLTHLQCCSLGSSTPLFMLVLWLFLGGFFLLFPM